ncbi:MAG: acyl-CoA thioesterase II [Methyloligellaceae bacterium]
MTTSVDEFLSVLNITPVEGKSDMFQGDSTHKNWKRIFGGQVIGQSLVAAQRTVEKELLAHSLHCYFMRPGDPQTPIEFEVDRIRDGRSFCTRRVVASQNNQAIFSLGASFHIVEDGLSHQAEMPETPMPEDLPTELEAASKFSDDVPEKIVKSWMAERPVEMRFADFENYFDKKKKTTTNRIWFKLKGSVEGDLALHQSILAYVSDYTLLGTAILPHGRRFYDRSIMAASLDHSVWFHRPFKVDEWLLYYTDTPSASGALGFCRGSIYDRAGNLIASVAQEGLIRPIDPSRQKKK